MTVGLYVLHLIACDTCKRAVGQLLESGVFLVTDVMRGVEIAQGGQGWTLVAPVVAE